MKKQGKLLIFSGSILAFLAFLLPSGVFAEPWTDPTCDPPNCNTEGPVWVNPDSAQTGYIDLDYSNNSSNVPVLQIIDSRTTASPSASIFVRSNVNNKPAIYGYATGTGNAYGGYFSSTNNAGIYLSGGLKFAGLSNLNEPSYESAGLLYYNSSSNLFKFYNGSQWVELSNQWTTNGSEIYRSFATTAAGQGVAIKSGDSSDPNDNYNLDVVRKSLSTSDRAVNGYLEAISDASYASGALGSYDSSGNMVGVKGNTSGTGAVTNYGGNFTAAGDTGIAVYGEASSTTGGSTTNYGGYFVANAGRGYGVYAKANSTADYSATGGYFESAATRGIGVYGRTTDTSSTYTKYGVYGRADGATDAAVYGWATSGDATRYHYGLMGVADNTNGIGLYAVGYEYSGIFYGGPVIISNVGGTAGAQIPVGVNTTYISGSGDLYVADDLEVEDMFLSYDGTITNQLSVGGTLSAGALDVSGGATFASHLWLGHSSDSDNDYLYFDAGTESIMWDNTNTRFTFSDDIYSSLTITANSSMTAPIYYSGTSTSYYLDPDAATSGRVYGNLQIGYGSATDNDYLYFDQNSEYIVWDNTNDRFYISHIFAARDVYNNALPATPRDVYIDSEGNFGYYSSSIRFKDNVKDMESIDWLYALRPVNFTYKTDDSKAKQYGLIAEEVEKINPALVSYGEDGQVDTVNYYMLEPILLEAVQNQQTEINELKEEIAELKKLLLD